MQAISLSQFLLRPEMTINVMNVGRQCKGMPVILFTVF